MKWTERPRCGPNSGEIRLRSGFLFLPKRIGYEWRWLEYAYWTEEWQVDGSYVVRWSRIKWLKLNVKLDTGDR